MSYFSSEQNEVVWKLAGSEGYTESRASMTFGTNRVLPNHLLALVFSKGNEDFYDYDTFVRLGFFIVNNYNCYIDYNKESIKNAIKSDAYLRQFLIYDDLGVRIANCVDNRPDYYHYQHYKLSEDDVLFVQAHKVEELTSHFMEKLVMDKGSIPLLRKVII